MGKIYFPHPKIHKGELILTNPKTCSISSGARIDLTGSVTLGKYVMIGSNARILTHDHYHEGRVPLRMVQQIKGVKWQDKIIGDDVWIHGAIVLYQVTFIPDGVVIGIGAVLTKNPEVPYGIYAGNPAVLIGER